MHPVIFYFAIAWTMILFIVTVVLVIRAQTVMSRLLALDTLTLILVAFLVLWVHEHPTSHYLDAVIVLALLSFTGTLVAARYYSERELFS